MVYNMIFFSILAVGAHHHQSKLWNHSYVMRIHFVKNYKYLWWIIKICPDTKVKWRRDEEKDGREVNGFEEIINNNDDFHISTLCFSSFLSLCCISIKIFPKYVMQWLNTNAISNQEMFFGLTPIVTIATKCIETPQMNLHNICMEAESNDWIVH